MGSSQSKEVEENPNFNFEQYNQKIAASGLYSENPMNLPNQADYYLRDNGFNPKPIKIQQSVVNKVTLNFSIVKHSLTISRSAQKIAITFKFTAKKQGQIKIFFMADETQQEQFGITTLTGQQQMTQYIKETNQGTLTRFIKVDGPINSLNLERKNNKKWFPFVISIGDEQQKIYTYARTVNNFQDTVIIKQKIQSNVFGLSKNSEEKLCIICYSEQSDVIIFPCGHLCLCFSCCGQLMRTSENCPICRNPISSYQRIKSTQQKKQEQ